jgi:hypothetical protein
MSDAAGMISIADMDGMEGRTNVVCMPVTGLLVCHDELLDAVWIVGVCRFPANTVCQYHNASDEEKQRIKPFRNNWVIK